MKKAKQFITHLVLLTSVLLSVSCSDDDSGRGKNNNDNNNNGGGNTTQADNEYVNSWIEDNMSDYYYWNNMIPDSIDLDYRIDPYDFFKNLLYKNDKYSYLEGTHQNINKATLDTKSDNIGTSDIGFQYIPIRFTDEITGETLFYRLIVSYIKNETQTAKDDVIKRGYIIKSVNGTEISLNNWYSILAQNKSSYEIEFYASVEDMENSHIQKTTIKTTPNYSESPILMNKVFEIEGRKIGYLVYNSFIAGGDNHTYDVELMKIFDSFRSQGVNDLILDLRYNGGGLVESAQYIASAIVPDRSTSDIFEISTYNQGFQTIFDEMDDNDKRKQEWMYSYFVDAITSGTSKLASIPNLGDQLDNLYFLTTGYTASASEMLINTLSPYYEEKGKNIVVIGTQTEGKNVGSWLFHEEEDAKNTYAMWPIVFRSHNKLYKKEDPDASSNYSSGFAPDIERDDFDMLHEGLKALGDQEETLLSAAISKLTGIPEAEKPETEKSARESRIQFERIKENKGGLMYTEKPDVSALNIKKLKEKSDK